MVFLLGWGYFLFVCSCLCLLCLVRVVRQVGGGVGGGAFEAEYMYERGYRFYHKSRKTC